MIDPNDKRYRPFLLFLERKRRGTFLVLTMEKTIQHTWRIAFWCLFFAGLWLLALPAFFGTIISIITLLSFLTGIAYFIRTDLLNFHFPDIEEIDKRLETRGTLGRGHISLIKDQLANPNIISTRLLWHKAQREGIFLLKKLRIPWVNTNLSSKDPHALRFIALLVFTSGIFIAGHNWKERIISGLTPVAPPVFNLPQNHNNIDLWIKPPSYTQMPETHISGSGYYDGILEIPEKSTYRIRVHSWFKNIFPPRLHIGKSSITLTHMGGKLYGNKGTIQQGTNIRITQALLPRATLPYKYIIDTPPEIRSDTKLETPHTDTAPYEILDDYRIRFPLVVKDDYGVKELRMTMRLDKTVKEAPLGQEYHETRLIMSQPNTEFKISPIYDLSWHSWAGLPVNIEITAIDHKRQSTTLEKIKLTLPEREFKHPLAKFLIAERKAIAQNYKNSFKQIALNIERPLNNPKSFQNDITIFLALRSASSRLFHNDNKPESQRVKAALEVLNLLWKTAIVIEDGNITLALRELKNARRALENAMRDPATDDRKIQALMEQLREKMINYFTEIARDMQKRIAQGENISFMKSGDFGSLITPDTLAVLMAQIEQAMRNGNKQQARELMSKLQRMMEMISTSNNTKLPSDMQMMREGINKLGKIIKRQKLLIEQTEKQAKIQHNLEPNDNNSSSSTTNNTNDLPNIEQIIKDFGMGNLPPAPQHALTNKQNKITLKQQIDTSENKAKQDNIIHMLDKLITEASKKIAKLPETMEMAKQEMSASAEKLEKNNPKDSLPHQNKAVKYLEDTQEKIAKQFRQRMQQMVGIGLSGTGQQLDPLGRPYGDTIDSAIKIPDKAQKKRVDEIIRKIRRRSSDRSRSREELKYYRRLLHQF